MKLKHITVLKKCAKYTNSDDEIDKNSCKPDDMALTSTPIKVKERKSVSLLDLSDIDLNLGNTKIHASSDTLGSSSSMCKDSGYNNSESSLASEKAKKDDPSFPTDFREEYFRLLEDLKFKNEMISSLHDLNYSLRMKIADAENKIFELRLKSESHCKCCSNQSAAITNTKPPFQYTLSPLTKSEPCLLIPPPTRNFKSNAVKKIPLDEPAVVPTETSFIKVKQWQNTYKECEKSVHSNVSPLPPESNKIYFRPAPEPLPHTMSYMETSRALAEGYRRRQETSQDLFSFQVIGDHSIAVSPVRLASSRHITDDVRRYTGMEKRISEPEVSEEEVTPVKESILSNILFRNQRSSSLYDCLTKANEYAASLAIGLSNLPSSLNNIRSSSGISNLLNDSSEVIRAITYFVLSLIFLFLISFFEN